VGVEIPAGHRWCQIRKVAFGWTKPNFPFVTVRKKLTLLKHSVITVIGKASGMVNTFRRQLAPAQLEKPMDLRLLLLSLGSASRDGADGRAPVRPAVIPPSPCLSCLMETAQIGSSL